MQNKNKIHQKPCHTQVKGVGAVAPQVLYSCHWTALLSCWKCSGKCRYYLHNRSCEHNRALLFCNSLLSEPWAGVGVYH